MYAGVEGGGTTWRVALAEGHPTNITESVQFDTLDNAQAQLKQIKDWLSTRKYDCLGIGTFGPVDPREVSLCTCVTVPFVVVTLVPLGRVSPARSPV